MCPCVLSSRLPRKKGRRIPSSLVTVIVVSCLQTPTERMTYPRREGNAIGPGLPLEFLLLLCFLRRFFSLFPFQYVKDRGGGAVTLRGTEAAESGVGAPCVENNGFEPLTPCVQSRCSSQLS